MGKITEKFVGKFKLVREENNAQCFQSETGDCYHVYGDHRNKKIKVGEYGDIYYRSTSTYGTLVSK